MDERAYAEANWDAPCENYDDWVDYCAVRDAKIMEDARYSPRRVEGARYRWNREGWWGARTAVAPAGLGGPREFAVPGHQLIALMEHVAAVRRLARRGWRYV